MSFILSDDQEAIKDSVKKICDQFSPNYWRDQDKAGEFPEDFVKAIQQNRDPAVDGAEGRRSVEIILAIYESSRSGQRISLPLKT